MPHRTTWGSIRVGQQVDGVRGEAWTGAFPVVSMGTDKEGQADSGLARQSTSFTCTRPLAQDGPVTQVGTIRVFSGIDISPRERNSLSAKVAKIGGCELGAAMGHLVHEVETTSREQVNTEDAGLRHGDRQTLGDIICMPGSSHA